MSDHEREGDDLLDEQAEPSADDVWSDEEPPERGPDGIEPEEHIRLTPPG